MEFVQVMEVPHRSGRLPENKLPRQEVGMLCLRTTSEFSHVRNPSCHIVYSFFFVCFFFGVVVNVSVFFLEL